MEIYLSLWIWRPSQTIPEKPMLSWETWSSLVEHDTVIFKSMISVNGIIYNDFRRYSVIVLLDNIDCRISLAYRNPGTISWNVNESLFNYFWYYSPVEVLIQSHQYPANAGDEALGCITSAPFLLRLSVQSRIWNSRNRIAPFDVKYLLIVSNVLV
jgi:hypothetical protein